MASSSSMEPTSTTITPNALTKDGKSPLLHAWHDPLANIKTNQNCVKLVDLNCDGDSKLCICDYDKKLRVYKGTNLLVDYAILETPIAIAVTYMDATLVRPLPPSFHLNLLFLCLFFIKFSLRFVAANSIDCCGSRLVYLSLSSATTVSQVDVPTS